MQQSDLDNDVWKSQTIFLSKSPCVAFTILFRLQISIFDAIVHKNLLEEMSSLLDHIQWNLVVNVFTVDQVFRILVELRTVGTNEYLSPYKQVKKPYFQTKIQ